MGYWSSSGDVNYDSGHTEGLETGTGIGYGIIIADFDSDGFNDLAIGTRKECVYILAMAVKGLIQTGGAGVQFLQGQITPCNFQMAI
jgi:hypothetical protein